MYIIVKHEWLNNVKFMYRDLDKISYLVVSNNATTTSDDVNFCISDFKGKIYNCWWYETEDSVYWDDRQYTSLGFTYEDKYSLFKIERDLQREKEVYESVIGSGDTNYIFIADDPKRNYIIDPFLISKLDNNTRIIRSSDLLQYNLFELLTLIEKSLEFHCMNSAIFALVDCASIKKIYLHNSYFLKVGPLEEYGEKMMNWLNNRNITHI